MTVVVAKRFGEHIEVLADTMISDRDRGREDAFPGRLKIIALSTDLTIAYAGHSDPALESIRRLHRDRIRSVDQALERLKPWTALTEHDVEFLVVSHQPTAELRKVWAGRISAPLNDAVLGDPTLRSALYERLTRTGDDAHDAKEFFSTFLHVFTSGHVNRGEGVGGFPTALSASPEGHHYRHHSFHHSWKPIEFLPGVEQHQDPADMQTGDWTFHHSVVAPREPGVAVLAAQIQQARRAFIYSPLLDDDAAAVPLLEPETDWTEHQVLMNERTVAALRSAVERAQSYAP
jgi:hypothetical protein